MLRISHLAQTGLISFPEYCFGLLGDGGEVLAKSGPQESEGRGGEAGLNDRFLIDIVKKDQCANGLCRLRDRGPCCSHQGDERIRKRIENMVFKYKDTKMPVTMTFGLSMYRGKDDNIEDCIKRADSALYEGKNQGRNRVIVA